MIHYRKLLTEQVNPASRHLDTLSIAKTIRLINRDNAKIHYAITHQAKPIEKAIRLMVTQFRLGGRLFFVGAGTSGRLGVMESAEMPPTFNTPPHLVQAIVAGGKPAVFRSQEGAEDNVSQGKKEIHTKVKAEDVVVGIAASGVTPFVKAALQKAKKQGAKTILVTCNPKTPFQGLDVLIAAQVGPEIIAGSTRLKSGTVTKMILNLLTTISMVKLGKVYKNRMVDLQPKSKKLRERAISLVQELLPCHRKKAIQLLKKYNWRVKTIVLQT
jgi:N-acetylmuramic acid 6-phosphate etherase